MVKRIVRNTEKNATESGGKKITLDPMSHYCITILDLLRMRLKDIRGFLAKWTRYVLWVHEFILTLMLKINWKG